MEQQLSAVEEVREEGYSLSQLQRNNSFGRDLRIVKPRDFAQFKSATERISRKSLTIILKERATSQSRLGIITSRKSGSAVIRNRFRRLVREFFRTNKCSYLPNDVLILAKKNLQYLSYSQVEKDLSVLK
jgi:ribonuclease P protein component